MLVNCRECAGTISDAAEFCPHCGAPASVAIPPKKSCTGLSEKIQPIAADIEHKVSTDDNYKEPAVEHFPQIYSEQQLQAKVPISSEINNIEDAEDGTNMVHSTQKKPSLFKRIFGFIGGFILFETIAIFFNQIFDYVPSVYQSQGNATIWPILSTLIVPLYTAIPFLFLMKIWGNKAVSVASFIIATLTPFRLSMRIRDISFAFSGYHFTAQTFSIVAISMCILGWFWTMYIMFGYRRKGGSNKDLTWRITTYILTNLSMSIYAYALWDMY